MFFLASVLPNDVLSTKRKKRKAVSVAPSGGRYLDREEGFPRWSRREEGGEALGQIGRLDRRAASDGDMGVVSLLCKL